MMMPKSGVEFISIFESVKTGVAAPTIL